MIGQINENIISRNEDNSETSGTYFRTIFHQIEADKCSQRDRSLFMAGGSEEYEGGPYQLLDLLRGG